MSDARYKTEISVATFKDSRFGHFPTELGPLIFVLGAVPGVLLFAALSFVFPPLATLVNGAGIVLSMAVLPYFILRLVGKRKNRKFIREVTDQVNESVLELTGDATQKLSVARVCSLLEKKGSEPLSVHGISGIEVGVTEVKSQYNANSHRVVLRVPKNDDGVESFDHLVHAAAAKNPDVKAVIDHYRA
jgi:hypothetical protein